MYLRPSTPAVYSYWLKVNQKDSGLGVKTEVDPKK